MDKDISYKENSQLSSKGKPAKMMQRDKSNRWLNECDDHFSEDQ